MAFVIASHEGYVFLGFATCARETSAVRCAADGQYTVVKNMGGAGRTSEESQ